MALTDKLTAIADAVREKAGTTDAMTLTQIAEAIAAIQTGGGGAFTSGTFTPLDKVYEIEHGLGQVPSCFMYVADFETITGRLMTSPNTVFSDEYCVSAKDATSYLSGRHKIVFILIGDKAFTYSPGDGADWGFYTQGSVSLPHSTNTTISCDETKFCARVLGDNSLFPYSTSGNITIHWYAIGGQ